MKRRQFIAGLGSAVAWPVVARAQQPKMPVIGWLSPATGARDRYLPAFRQGLGVPRPGSRTLWHAGCCVLFLIAYEMRGMGEDDRPPRRVDVDPRVSKPSLGDVDGRQVQGRAGLGFLCFKPEDPCIQRR
jgi:hypothetical protein